MKSIKQPLTVEARLSWALLWMVVVLFLGTLFWGMLNPHFQTINDVSNQTMGADSEAAQTGWVRISFLWDYWPVWFAGAMMFYGYRRAVNESKAR